MYIKRRITDLVEDAAKQFPVVSILGPRQSGKTTLAKQIFSNYKYISLEDLDRRAFAINDPREFLKYVKDGDGVILDEIQHVPTLLSYIQTEVDANRRPGFFVLTGSQNFLLNQSLTQTLAGRMAVLKLMPLSIRELDDANIEFNGIEELIFKGSYPTIYAQQTKPSLFYSSYIFTYIERDVQQVTDVGDLTQFRFFLKMCAGRVGQLLNVTQLANDCGLSLYKTNQWLSILQASYIIFLLQPYHKNFSKRLVKTPKLYFYDTGIASWLLDIESEEQLRTHYLKGGLTENLIITDFNKEYYNSGREPHSYFWRDNHGHELDCLLEKGQELYPIEIKSGYTVSQNYFTGLKYWNDLSKNNPENGYVIYSGDESYKRSLGNILSWKHVYKIIDNIYGKF